MEMEARDETPETLAKKTGIYAEIWQRTLEGCEIDESLAIALESIWDISAQFWLNLWINYFERMGEKRPSELPCSDCFSRMVSRWAGDRWTWSCNCQKETPSR